MILAAVPSCAAGEQSSSSTPTYRKNNSTPHAGHAQSAVSLEVVENVTEAGLQRQREVGEGNRFAARGEVPRGLGRKE